MDLPTPIPSHQSATFQERGVSVPFTTPALAGARVRRDARHGLALLVPNPSGGRGIYVLPWSGVRDMCHPTLHDGMLHDTIAAAKGEPVSPSVVRAAARRVAADGAAGRAAHAAATKAIQTESESRQATNRYLLYALAAQTTVQASAAEVAALAGVVDEVGIGPYAARAGIPVRLAQLKGLREELAAWSNMGADETGYMSMACGMADLAIRCGQQVVAAARDRMADVEGLLADWRARADDLAAVFSRPAWVLDGWSLPCLLWGAASGDAARRAALIEIGQMLAVLPKEAGHWIGASIEAEANQATRPMVGLNQDRRAGLSALDLVARNERFRALAA